MDPREREPVRFTNLKQISLSPAHYRSAAASGYDKKVFASGRLLHYLTLGGEYVVYEGKRQGKAWKEFAAEEKRKNPRVEIFTRAEVNRKQPVADAIRRHPLAGPMLEGEHEVPIDWEYTEVGGIARRCSSRLDVLNRREGRVVDLKSAATAQPDRFGRNALRYGYHAQGGWYADAAAFIGVHIEEVILISVEPVAPYAITVFRLTERALQEGRKLCRLWMERLIQCEEVDEWPEYAQSIISLDVDADAELIFADDADPIELDDGEEAA